MIPQGSDRRKLVAIQANEGRPPQAQPATEAKWGVDRETDEFLLSRRAINCTASTLEWYARCVGKLASFLRRKKIPSTRQLTPALMRRFLVSLQDAGHSPGGVVTIYVGVRAYLKWFALEYGLERWNPLAGVKPPKRPDDPLPPVKLEHVRLLVAVCPAGRFTGDRDRALFYFLLDSGVRHQELTNLQVGHVDRQSGRIHVQLGKGQKSRRVFVGSRTLAALEAYLAHRPATGTGDPLWIGVHGQQLTTSGIREIVRRRANAAHIQEPGLHAFRRAFAINCLRNGMDVISLQRLMGHANLETIHRYLAQVDDDLRRAHRLYGVVDEMGVGVD